MGQGINQRAAVIGTSDTPVFGPNASRKALIISSPQINRMSVTIGGPAVAAQGLVINPGQPAMVLHHRDYGDILRNGINAICDPAGETVAFTEIMDV